MEENSTPKEEIVNEVENSEVNTEKIDSSANQSTNETEKLNETVKELNDKYLRLFAEFDNFKKRTAREKNEMMLTAGKEIIISLLGVLDDCDRAEKQLKASTENGLEMEGTFLVFNKLRSILQQKGLSPMESISFDFDVEKHEAITELEVSEELKGKVIDELEKGYYLNNKLIRFAKVVVGK
jgi:molecular chaperone GrpE